MLELRRQIFHILSILSLVPLILYLPRWAVILTLSLGIVLNLLLVLRNPFVLRVFSPLVSLLERKENLSKPGIGALWALLGVFVSYLLFGKGAVVGVVVLALGDGLSTLAGKLIGRHRLFYNPEKSLEGTLAFFLGSFLGLSFFLEPLEAFFISLVCALFESLPLGVDDNLTLPIFASLLGEVI
ncbi:MAG: phosphatidate cytidylyltransferase [Aquificae bacterium]|nr:phosphatidate cytidylyltransferase [Aquificota bacterium]